MCNVACANCLIVAHSIQQIKTDFCLGDYVSFFTNTLKMISWTVLHFLFCAVIVFHVSVLSWIGRNKEGAEQSV